MKIAVESMEMASGGTSPSRQGAGTEISVPRTRVDDGGGYGTFRGRRLLFGSSRRRQYIGERAMSVGARGAHTMSRGGQGGPRLDLVWLLWGSNWADLLAPAVFQGFGAS